jgi:hypothetical protein
MSRSPLQHGPSRTPRRSAALVAASLLAASLVTVGVGAPAAAQTSTTYDFNTPGDLATYFNGVGPGAASVTQSTTTGIGGSGAISVPRASVNAVYTSKEGYSLGPVGSIYTFSTFIKSEGNSGYSGVGFTTASPTTADDSSGVFRPTDALGISVHGGGFEFHDGAVNYSGLWGSTNSAPITAVKVSSCSDLINNNTACGSPDKWFRFVFRIERATTDTFDLRVEVWPADADGTLRFPEEATAIFEVNGITNSTIRNAPQIFAYFNFSGDRVTAFDDYRIELGGGATVVQAGAPVVLTGSVSTVDATLSVAGEVKFQGDSAVTERGFVYGTGASPTVADTKVTVGDGTGAFSGTTVIASAGTYTVRAFASNGSATSYGAALQVEVAGGGGGGGNGDGGDRDVGGGGGGTADPLASTVAPIVERSASLGGTESLLLRRGDIIPLTTAIRPTGGPRGSLLVTGDDVRITIASTGGVSPTRGIIAPSGGEIVCEICARLAAGTTIEAWLYSEPRLAAAVEVDGTDGVCPYLRIPLGALLDGAGPIGPGAHTLQLRYQTVDGLEVVAVRVDVVTTSPSRVSAGEGPLALAGAMPMHPAAPLVIALAAMLALGMRRGRTRASN